MIDIGCSGLVPINIDQKISQCLSQTLNKKNTNGIKEKVLDQINHFGKTLFDGLECNFADFDTWLYSLDCLHFWSLDPSLWYLLGWVYASESPSRRQQTTDQRTDRSQGQASAQVTAASSSFPTCLTLGAGARCGHCSPQSHLRWRDNRELWQRTSGTGRTGMRSHWVMPCESERERHLGSE
mgnify:CR=1 FL=1